MRLAVLVSGRGSNLGAVLDAVAGGRLPGLEPVLVISNRSGVPALAVAAAHGVPSRVLARAGFASAELRDAAIGRAVAGSGAELALLAGYDQLLRAPYFAAFRGRTINIHPSLLPRHGGRGMVGLAVHRSVLAAGDTMSGVTVHEVTESLDAGPAIAQVEVPVRRGETAEELAQRVLAVEHRTLVEVLARLAAEGSEQGASASMTAASPPTGAARAPHERRRTHA
ncbi:MAG TPA: phosphoribosylglycinamide formyltransferase [Candidatus Limnocylindria bacterium]|nr:phosphoribosylglycinamide formyltransferase [Candidatus Limnocylindria bacterium]